MTNIPIETFVEYEIRSSWWCKDISNKILQNLAAKYFVWKTKRKYSRYSESIKMQKELLRMGILIAELSKPTEK